MAKPLKPLSFLVLYFHLLGAEPFSPEYPSWLLIPADINSANLEEQQHYTGTKLKLSVPAEEVQLLIMGVEVLLKLLRAHETTVALVTRPVLLLLSENCVPLERSVTAFQTLSIKCLFFFSPSISILGCISPLKWRQTAEHPAQPHSTLLLAIPSALGHNCSSL